MSWKLSGSYFEFCDCETAIPRVFLSVPPTGECSALPGPCISTTAAPRSSKAPGVRLFRGGRRPYGRVGQVYRRDPLRLRPDLFDEGESWRAMRVGEVAAVMTKSIAARSEHLRYTDHGYEWDLYEFNDFFSPFSHHA